jgi:hypothetical protein
MVHHPSYHVAILPICALSGYRTTLSLIWLLLLLLSAFCLVLSMIADQMVLIKMRDTLTRALRP